MTMPKPIRALALLATSLCLLAGPGQAADIKIKALIPAKLINEAFSPLSVAKYLGWRQLSLGRAGSPMLGHAGAPGSVRKLETRPWR